MACKRTLEVPRGWIGWILISFAHLLLAPEMSGDGQIALVNKLGVSPSRFHLLTGSHLYPGIVQHTQGRSAETAVLPHHNYQSAMVPDVWHQFSIVKGMFSLKIVLWIIKLYIISDPGLVSLFTMRTYLCVIPCSSIIGDSWVVLDSTIGWRAKLIITTLTLSHARLSLHPKPRPWWPREWSSPILPWWYSSPFHRQWQWAMFSSAQQAEVASRTWHMFLIQTVEILPWQNCGIK
jgi:hypothetical protein